MLRWYQKTYQILDGPTFISKTRYHISSIQHAAITRTANIGQIPVTIGAEALHKRRKKELLSSNSLEHKACITNAPSATDNSCSTDARHCIIDPAVSLISRHPSSTSRHLSSNTDNDQSCTLKVSLPWHKHQQNAISLVDIAAMYRRIPKAVLLKHLDGNDISNMIALFGHSPEAADVNERYASAFVKSVQHWGKKSFRLRFLREVGKDMQRLGLSISGRDKYWMMKAHLLELAGTHSSDQIIAKLGTARMLYLQLHYPQDVVVQVDFLNHLIRSSEPSLVQEGVDRVCELIKHPVNTPDVFIRMFCSTVLHLGPEFSPAIKEQICSAIYSRLEHHLLNEEPATEHGLQPVDISVLTSSLVQAVFQHDKPRHPRYLSLWSISQCRQCFSPSTPLEQQWDNLVLLATHCYPSASRLSSSNELSHSQCVLWRTSFILDALHSHMSNANLSSEHLSIIKEVARRSWSSFASADAQSWPLDIVRIYVGAFLHIAATTFSESLRQHCMSYLQRNNHLNSSLGSRQQALHLCSEYLHAYLACEGQNWNEVEHILNTLCPDPGFERQLSDVLLSRYIPVDLSIASKFYFFGRERNTSFDPHLVHHLASKLIAQQQWGTVSHILREPGLPEHIVEQLFISITRHFQVNRLENAPPSLIKLLGQIACFLYERKPVPPAAKYPLRYLFGLMVAGYAELLVKTAGIALATTPDLFSPHLIERLVFQIGNHRQVKQAAAFLDLFSHMQSPSLSALRSKFVVLAASKGAPQVAKRVSSSISPDSKTSKSLQVTRAIRFGSFPKSPEQLRRVSSLLREIGTTPGAIVRGVEVLIKAKKLYVVRKLLKKKADHLDTKTKTSIGNMILHASMGPMDLRNGRLVRFVLRTKDLLMESYGFVPDRATLNIIVKAVLRWQGMVDASQVRRLFDQMAHEGYPVPEHWCKKHGVPFGTPPGSTERIALPSLAPHISFAKHTRPLYKLFIKAFYLRHDVSAAKTVVGILKEVEVDDIREKEKRNKARRDGIIKKRKRLANASQQNRVSK